MIGEPDRLDHRGWVPEIYIGLIATALWMMQIGPTITTMSDYVEDWIAFLLFTGSAICTIGVVIGTKFGKVIAPKAGRRVAYLTQLVGLPLIIGTLGWLTYASVDPNNLVLTALAGGLGLCIEIGAVRLFIDLIQEVSDGED